MRNKWLLCVVLLFGSCAVSSADCGVWPKDRECFRQQIIYFTCGSCRLSSEGKQKVAQVAHFLNAHPSAAVVIEGHSDDRSSEEHNRWLGDRRAQAVAKELVRLGVATERVDAISYGQDRPADSGHGAKARQKNRRAEFVLLTPPI